MNAGTLGEALESRKGIQALGALYGSTPEARNRHERRYRSLIARFGAAFPGAEAVRLFSTPGRTEICGNHTDHNGGRVLAAAVDLDAIAVAAPTMDG
jgi:galactokinase